MITFSIVISQARNIHTYIFQSLSAIAPGESIQKRAIENQSVQDDGSELTPRQIVERRIEAKTRRFFKGPSQPVPGTMILWKMSIFIIEILFS